MNRAKTAICINPDCKNPGPKSIKKYFAVNKKPGKGYLGKCKKCLNEYIRKLAVYKMEMAWGNRKPKVKKIEVEVEKIKVKVKKKERKKKMCLGYCGKEYYFKPKVTCCSKCRGERKKYGG